MKCPPWPKGKKLVHLDLKGAPPRVEYLHKLIELFSELGVNGLLVEYEDMFPYEGQLKLLQATVHPAYSREEVLSMQELARSKGMEVIPLVQTFGHMEFVLKHPHMWNLREAGHCVGTLNPHKEDSLKLVMEMLRQVVELHPGLNTLHIGADEVYMLGEGEESKLWLASSGHTVEQLFLSHVTKVAKAIKEAWPHMTIIMWDDMMRGMSEATLKASGLVGLVQPMLWDYTPNLDVDKTVCLLEKYCSAGMSDVWAASSFKGSTSVFTCVCSTQRHLDNHLQWLKVAALLSAAVSLKGIAITGWQRYDHLSVLCELLPVALPSLAACLLTLLHGQFGAEVSSRVSEKLGIPSVEVSAPAVYLVLWCLLSCFFLVLQVCQRMVESVPPTEEDGDPAHLHAGAQSSFNVSMSFQNMCFSVASETSLVLNVWFLISIKQRIASFLVFPSGLVSGI
uniref:beta-N-acetylhexosaminidase n=1 Tax=Salarias fasciatus TaxID=181472 RepID=A0A672IHI5_SALFA